MRLVPALAALVFSSPAFAASQPTGSQFSTSWSPMPSTHFSASDRSTPMRLLSVHAAALANGIVDEAFSASAKVVERRDLAINEIAAGWEPARRAALEDLRDAQRAYASAAGGDREMRGQRFVALLKQVVDDNGRSVAREPSSTGDEMLSQAYDRVIRSAPDDRLTAIEASETAWVAYRDAFDHFAQTMDRPDVAKALRDDLARHRVVELQTDEKR